VVVDWLQGKLQMAKAAWGIIAGKQTVPRAELAAATVAIRELPGPQLHLHTDCQLVVTGSNKAPGSGLSGSLAGAWSKVWKVYQYHDQVAHVPKVPAHTALEDVQYGRVSAKDQFGNAMADVLAGLAAQQVEASEAEEQSLGWVDTTVWQVLTRLAATNIACWELEPNQAPKEEARNSHARPKVKPAAKHLAILGHKLESVGHRLQCTECIHSCCAKPTSLKT